MVLPAKLASAKCIAVFFFCLFIYLHICFFVVFLLIVCLTGPQIWLC